MFLCSCLKDPTRIVQKKKRALKQDLLQISGENVHCHGGLNLAEFG
jgi:hypothetical protein